MRNVDQVYAELRLEQKKLNTMPLDSPFVLRQSIVVDRLINEYYQALAEYRRQNNARS